MASTQDPNDRAYHFAMARRMTERGYPNLADAHLFRARFLDDPPGCPCPGCALTRAESAEARERKTRRGMQRQVRASA